MKRTRPEDDESEGGPAAAAASPKAAGADAPAAALALTTPPAGPMTLCYFQLFAKGPSAALALAHSGLPWRGRFPADWKQEKPSTPWLHLPTLEVPGIGTIGHELAILHFIASVSPQLYSSAAELANSMQLISQSEDVYQKLTRMQDTLYAKDKVPRAELVALWQGSDPTSHNRTFGFTVYLARLEAFHASCGTAAAGRFTASGVSAGECKLFATLHMLKLIQDGVLTPFPVLAGFYERFAAEPRTAEVMETGGEFPGPFKQYFVAGAEQSPAAA